MVRKGYESTGLFRFYKRIFPISLTIFYEIRTGLDSHGRYTAGTQGYRMAGELLQCVLQNKIDMSSPVLVSTEATNDEILKLIMICLP